MCPSPVQCGLIACWHVLPLLTGNDEDLQAVRQADQCRVCCVADGHWLVRVHLRSVRPPQVNFFYFWFVLAETINQRLYLLRITLGYHNGSLFYDHRYVNKWKMHMNFCQLQIQVHWEKKITQARLYQPKTKIRYSEESIVVNQTTTVLRICVTLNAQVVSMVWVPWTQIVKAPSNREYVLVLPACVPNSRPLIGWGVPNANSGTNDTSAITARCVVGCPR